MILKHRFSNTPPSSNEIAIGEIVLQLFKDTATLFTKSVNGEVIELGKGALKLEDLEDVDLTNMKDGSFLIRQDGKFVASNFIGSIGNLSDVEISNPQAGDYLRYDPFFLSFRNFKPSYNLYELLDVDIPDSTNESESFSMNDMTLYYDHPSGKFKVRERRKFINQLDDVDISAESYNQLLQLDSDGIWRNMDLEIVRDTSPALGGSLNANGNQILNSAYKINTLVCNLPIMNINYAQGDYWVLEGVPISVNEQCIVNINFSSPLTNATAILMLEVRQDTGNILIGGLSNIKYEDGKPLQLSGAGKTDLITITINKTGSVYTSYITPAALNLATAGNGGIPAYRYDKNRYPDIQLFEAPTLYDDYFEYVQLLLNFEEEASSGKLWYEDKSDFSHLITTTAIQTAIDIYTYGLQEYVATFESTLSEVTLSTTLPITLLQAFTFECFINHPYSSEYIAEDMEHVLFENEDNTFSIKYVGSLSTSQDTYLQLKIHDNVINYPNAYNYFRDKDSKYVHIAIVRDTTVRLYIDGVRQVGIENAGLISITEDIVINSGVITGFKGLLNTIRVTNYPRYTDNFQIPDMRFGLIGGANDILEAQVFDTYMNLDKELEFNWFC